MGVATTSRETRLAASDGDIDVVLAQPETGTYAGVLFLTDIGGIRPTQTERILRLASEGFVVAMPNLCYRTRRPPLFDFPRNMKEERSKQRFAELTEPMTSEAVDRDLGLYVGWLTTQPGVASGPIGVVGHCFSGGYALRAAAVRPDHVAFAASFHGGGLASEKPDSPHKLLPKIRARLYFGHAVEDASMPADAIARLDDALRAWGGQFESEVYAGAHHGWTASDGPVFNPPQAERAFQRIVSGLRAELP
jgi:carboxymethylenebutenolidase